MPTLARSKYGVYYIVAKVGSKRQWRSTGTKNRSQALRALVQSSEPRETTPSDAMLSKSITDYIEHVRATFASKTYQVYGLALSHLLRFTGDVPVQTVSPRTIDLYKIERLKRVSPATVNLELRAIKTFFNCLRKWEMVPKNPCDGLTPVRIPQRLPAFFSKEEFTTFVHGLNDQWLKRIVLFAGMTGARLGEVLNLRWEDVDLNARVVLIRSSESYWVKNGKIRSLPLNETAISTLDAQVADEHLVFPGRRGGQANPNYVSKCFRFAVRKAGLNDGLHFHSLRHTFASLLVQNGVSLYQVQQLLGHSSSRVTEIYAHLQSPKLHHVVEILQLRSDKQQGADTLAASPSRSAASENSASAPQPLFQNEQLTNLTEAASV